MCYYHVMIAKPPFTKPPFVNSRLLQPFVGLTRGGASWEEEPLIDIIVSIMFISIMLDV